MLGGLCRRRRGGSGGARTFLVFCGRCCSSAPGSLEKIFGSYSRRPAGEKQKTRAKTVPRGSGWALLPRTAVWGVLRQVGQHIYLKQHKKDALVAVDALKPKWCACTCARECEQRVEQGTSYEYDDATSRTTRIVKLTSLARALLLVYS